jgi:enolase
MDFRIEKISGIQVLDSRGTPTIRVTVATSCAAATATAPSGASTGKREAFELRDNGTAYHGKSVQKALDNLHTIIAPALCGMDVREQETIDKKLIAIDATKNKNVLGGNTTIATSLAVCRCAAKTLGRFVHVYLDKQSSLLPIPFMNVINGGMHAGNDLAIQEHMIAPVGVSTFEEAVRACSEIYHSLKKILHRSFGNPAINVGDEGGFAPPLARTEDALDVILQAIEEQGYGDIVRIALDAAASAFYENGRYLLGTPLESMELLDYYVDLCKTYPIVSVEDAFHEDDWDAFTALTRKLDANVQVVGDDIFVTNPVLIRRAIKQKTCNALLLKPNQVGTLTETVDVARICQKNGYGVMVSHRSGDTCDTFIADSAVGLQTGQIKSGAPARGERVTKYNRLLEIEQTLLKPVYAGKDWSKKGLCSL